MTKEEALQIIIHENLCGYNFGDKPIGANEVGMQACDASWKVYCSDEKAGYRTIASYPSESKAIQHIINCLRIDKKFEDRFAGKV